MSEPASRISRRRQAALVDGSSDYAAKRTELIRIAADVFREKGYASATLNDVASRFGTDRASLYYYVGSKEELFQESIKSTVIENIAKAELISALDISPREKLERLIAVVIRSQVEHYPYMFVYIQEDMRQVVSQDAAWANEMVEQTHRFERYFLDAIHEGIADGTFRDDLSATLTANALFGMMMWTHRWWTPDSHYTDADLVRTFANILFTGLTAAPA